ncbi:CRISPR-associated endonuclease Cas6 [Eisenibacter elegans]|uniref:CRISPR-associated endonuclease Cas6 n=1 Tax=Eisenibacter elegans TaxID=997 RepID=UPI000408825A|nr:CRISPR-associated endonuclease Cas6 [Eisenibacter elegans]
MTQISTTLIRFPEIKLPTSAAQQLRGYFGNLFKEQSPLLHNHYEDGKSIYRYPLVQYKVIDKVPTLLGINEGAQLLVQLFLKIKEIDLSGRKYLIQSKNIEALTSPLEVKNEELFQYKFKTLWLGLNQENHKIYKNLQDDKEKQKLLEKILTANLISLSKGLGYTVKDKIMVKSQLLEKSTKFKGEEMLAFSGQFICNMQIPKLLGIGKAVSRGYGAVIQV